MNAARPSAQDDARISEIRALHFENADDPDVCYECGREWPCDEAYVVARLDALTAERDELLVASRECRESMSRAMTAMARDVVTINDLKARLAAAESALRWYADDENHVNMPREDIGHRARVALEEITGRCWRDCCDRVTLAGSREQAQGE